MFGLDAEGFQIVRRFVVAGHAVPAFKDGGTDLILIQPESFGEQFKGPCRLFLFEIIAERPIAHHLEKGEMGRIADRVDIDRADAPLHVAEAGARGVFSAQKVGHEGLHTRDVEHNARRTVSDERHRADVDVSLALVKLDPFVPEFFGCDHIVFIFHYNNDFFVRLSRPMGGNSGLQREALPLPWVRERRSRGKSLYKAERRSALIARRGDKGARRSLA